MNDLIFDDEVTSVLTSIMNYIIFDDKVTSVFTSIMNDLIFDDEVTSVFIFGDLFMRSMIENKKLWWTNVWYICKCCTT